MKNKKILLIVILLLICNVLFYKFSYEPNYIKSVCLSTAKSSYLVKNMSNTIEKQERIDYLYANCAALNSDVPGLGNGIYYEANNNLYPKFLFSIVERDSILGDMLSNLPFSTATYLLIGFIFLFLFGLWLLISYKNNEKLGFKIFGILIFSFIALIILFIIFLNQKIHWV